MGDARRFAGGRKRSVRRRRTVGVNWGWWTSRLSQRFEERAGRIVESATGLSSRCAAVRITRSSAVEHRAGRLAQPGIPLQNSAQRDAELPERRASARTGCRNSVGRRAGTPRSRGPKPFAPASRAGAAGLALRTISARSRSRWHARRGVRSISRKPPHGQGPGGI